jgi:hypothetical protein
MMRHTSMWSQVNLSNLRLRGGHGLPALIAARFISPDRDICRACDLVSSRRLATPPRRPISARYSRTHFSVSVIVSQPWQAGRLPYSRLRLKFTADRQLSKTRNPFRPRAETTEAGSLRSPDLKSTHSVSG